jgi:hypothetical protein
LRRNAALEERAAASIARAKAVVEGSDAAALKANGRSAGLAESMSVTAEQFASETAAAAYDSPPTPPQEPAPPTTQQPAGPASRNASSTGAGGASSNASRPSSARSGSTTAASAAAATPEVGLYKSNAVDP